MREHTEIIQPPRALWVTFVLGRPLGAPDDPALQTRVLRAALALLDAPSGPVLADYPERIAEADLEGWACPVNFAAKQDASPDDLAAALQREIRTLAPWHLRAIEQAGRTTVGVSTMTMPDAAAFLAAWLDDAAPAPTGPASLKPSDAIKYAIEDLKAFYLEAARAQPGGARLSIAQQAEWLWGGTALGRLFLALQPVLARNADPLIRWISVRTLVPATQAHRQTPSVR
ncbi:MAG: hypothetical protein JO021_16210 [Alphaproteobacteria bacterium]|nr:hypothetical protein [Alphaproteobacteria bacterium]